MATSRLAIYNAALRLCGQRKLSAVDEDAKSRYLLDDAWDNDGVLRCLEAGEWKFAMRASELTYSSDLDPPFGYRRAFEKPEDLVRLTAMCQDEFFRVPLADRYYDEGDYWFSDLDTMYVRYVSDDDQFGMDFAKWPGSFTEYVETFFASKIVTDLTQDEKKRLHILDPNKGLLTQALGRAKTNDALKEPTKFAPQGSWISSRGGGRGDDRGGGPLTV